ncbi:GNAT family N-acetyltransferase [Limnobacter sp.]|uniref:GNAT family N-acetyltransferase n=1 Tax=Limnobacter sp. TaxID=2003368 RepID=UPI0032EE5764
MRFEAWSGQKLVGLVAAYCNDQQRHIVYISSVSVLKAWTCNGIAANLILQCIKYSERTGMRQIRLEVYNDNSAAIKLYEKNGFVTERNNGAFVNMQLNLCLKP